LLSPLTYKVLELVCWEQKINQIIAKDEGIGQFHPP